MADTTISSLPSASANPTSVVPADSADGSLTSKVTLGSIAAIGGGPPASHASSHASGGFDPITPASIGAVASSDSRLSDSRQPTSHASTHGSAGVDPITPAAIGAAAASHDHVLANVSDAGTAASRNVPASGNATTTQVVLGSDTRLADSRTPTAHAASHRCTGSDYPAPVVLSPSLSASQDDWSPGVADVYFVTASGNVNITGLVAPASNGFSVTVVNVGQANTITLAHESSSSSAANRLRSSYGGSVILYPDGGSATLVYHAASARWRVL